MRISDWSSDVCSSELKVAAVPSRGRVDHAIVVVLGKAGTNGANIGGDVLALLRAVSRQFDHLPSVLEASQRRRFLDGGEVEYRMNRPCLLELGFQHYGNVALLEIERESCRERVGQTGNISG